MSGWKRDDGCVSAVKHFKGHLPGLDGRLVPCRSEHSALNFACSSIEAILCKMWICDSADALEAKGYVWGRDFTFMSWIHDEINVACRESISSEVGKTLVTHAKAVGAKLGYFEVELQRGGSFRFYSGAVSDPKAQMLSPEMFKHWVNVL